MIFVILGHLIVPTTLGQNVAHVIGNNTMLERKGNNLVVNESPYNRIKSISLFILMLQFDCCYLMLDTFYGAYF